METGGLSLDTFACPASFCSASANSAWQLWLVCVLPLGYGAGTVAATWRTPSWGGDAAAARTVLVEISTKHSSEVVAVCMSQVPLRSHFGRPYMLSAVGLKARQGVLVVLPNEPFPCELNSTSSPSAIQFGKGLHARPVPVSSCLPQDAGKSGGPLFHTGKCG